MHSHWTINGSGQLDINWGKYGDYVLQYDPVSNIFSGSVKGDPAKWRRARFVRALGIDVLGDVPAHDHGHVHDANCKH